jgi:CubicO group peptidase (beta-lactamase class C family)
MKKILKITVFCLALLGLIFYIFAYPKLDLISGFSAKSVASGTFLDNRSLAIIESGDNDIPLVDLARNSVNLNEQFAISSVYGIKERKAIYRPGLGATLVDESFDVLKPYLIPRRTLKPNTSIPYPFGAGAPKDSTFGNIDYGLLKKTIAQAFDSKGEKRKRTRAVVVLYKDHLIYEQYADGFTKDSRLLGWSMTKSLTGTYFGILQYQGKINIRKPAPIAAWQNDDRKKITLHNLLQMNSGLEWEEQYDKICDATQMLFQARDMAAVQRDKPLVGKPNSSWNYSSGTTNLLSSILRQQFASHQDYLDFWYNSLLDKIGMHSALVETDMAGNFVGSSYGWATPRDWAKFGLLYLHKGLWNGERLFAEEWAKYVATPTPTSEGRYGAQFWLNAGGKFPDVPRSMFYCSGFQGQMVAIFPEHDLVIVRMGLKEDPGFDFNGLLSGIVKSIQK